MSLDIAIYFIWLLAMLGGLFFTCLPALRLRYPAKAPAEPDAQLLPGVFSPATVGFFPEPQGYVEAPPQPPVRAPQQARIAAAIGMALSLCGAMIPLFGALPGGIGFFLCLWCRKKPETKTMADIGVVFGTAALLEALAILCAAMILA